MPIRNNDWDVAKRHLEIVQEMMPSGHRPLVLVRQIEGYINNRVTKALKQGTYVMPLDSEIVMTFSDKHDVERKSRLVFAQDTTTHQSSKSPDSMLLIEKIRTAFASRRVTDLPGELYSFYQKSAYDIDDDAPRRWDILVVNLTTRFREDR